MKRNKVKLLKAVAKVTYKEWAAYRTHSMVSIFIGPVRLFVMVLIWNAIYSETPVLNGMTLAQVVTYYGISTLIDYATMDSADWNLQMLVRTGKYLTFALRPVHHRFFALSQKVGHRILGLIFEFVPVCLILAFVFKINLFPVNVAYAAVSILLSFFMMFYINYSIGLAAFWVTNTAGLRKVYHFLLSVFSGTLIPLSFFPGWIQKVMFFFPFQYVNYIPAMVYTGSITVSGESVSVPFVLCLQGVYVMVMFMISEILYRAGMRRFTGVGA